MRSLNLFKTLTSPYQVAQAALKIWNPQKSFFLLKRKNELTKIVAEYFHI